MGTSVDSRRVLTLRSPVEAWERLTGRDTGSVRVTPVRPTAWSDARGRLQVFRLDGLAAVEGPVAAIRCSADRAAHEAHLYGDLLPGIGVPTVRHFGVTPDPESAMAWQFVEFLETPRSVLGDPARRRSFAEWLGILHGHGAVLRGAGLPLRDADFHHDQLVMAQNALEGYRGELAARPAGEDLAVVESALDRLAALDERWPGLAAELADTPWSVVHADLKPKNVGVRTLASAHPVLPFDWEYAGWGPVAVDLGPSGVMPDESGAYLARVHPTWPTLSRGDVHRLTRVGAILRAVMATKWAVDGLGLAPPHKTRAQLAYAVSPLEAVEQEW